MCKKIYAISSGEYEDYHIDYTFESEAKRDTMIKLLNEGRGHIYDSEYFMVIDDGLDLKNIKHFYYAECFYSIKTGLKFKFKKGNSLQKELEWKYGSYCYSDETKFFRIMSETEMDMPLEHIKKMLTEEAIETIKINSAINKINK